MIRVNQSTKNLIISILEDHVSKWYSTLQEILKPSEDVLMSSGWIPYLKSVECEFKEDGNSYGPSIKPNVLYYPDINSSLGITTPSGKYVNFSDLFKISEDIIDVLKSEGFKFSEPYVQSATQELILLALESKDRNLPPLDEVKKRIREYIDKFLERALSNKIKILSVAPLIGCKVDEEIEFDNDCILRPITCEDISVIAVARGLNLLESVFLDIQLDSPVLVARHEIDTPYEFFNKRNYYNEEEYMQLLRDSFRRKTDHVLLSLRLSVGEPVGYYTVYHVDDLLTSPRSLKVVTEEPDPSFRITTLYEVAGRKSIRLSLFSYRKLVTKKSDILNIYNKIKDIYSSLNNNSKYILLALKYYSRSMDESDDEWAILCLTNALESVCKYLRGEGRYSTGERITRVLRDYGLSLTDDEERLIEEAYEVRSQFIAHPSVSNIDSNKIKNIKINLYKLVQKVIQTIMSH